MNLDPVPTTGAKVRFMLTGLTGTDDEGHAQFTVPFELVPTPPAPRLSSNDGTSAFTPRYTYGLGYYGYGYYSKPAPGAVVSSPSVYENAARPRASTPAAHRTRDWATGRDVPLAKPWMSPHWSFNQAESEAHNL